MKAVFTQRAAAQLSEIQAYIAKDDPAAAERVVTAILDTADFLAESPDIGRHVRKPTDPTYHYRFHVVSSYRNYLVFYRPFPWGIRVVKVMAAAQDWTRFFQA
ncbi:MAG: type II toxin-antitoxin system RelE/ParE family toxin [Verrucomicrobiota bacterium]